MVPSLRKLSYSQRLERLKMTTLERRSIRGDIIGTYKILTGKDSVTVQRTVFKSVHSEQHLDLSTQRT